MTVPAPTTPRVNPFHTLMESGNERAHCAMLELSDEVPGYCTQSIDLRFWLPLSGSTELFPRRGRPYSVSSGSRVAIFPPGAVWEGAWRGRQTCLMLQISQSMMREFTRAQIVFPNDHQLILVEDERIRYGILALHQDMLAPTPVSDLFLEHIARGIALHYFKAYCACPETEAARTQKLAPRDLQRVLEVIEERLHSKLMLGELAGMLGLNVTSFCRRFKNSTGMPPYQYLLHARVRRAKELLHRRQTTSLSELALALGFYDQSQFTNTFRKIVGVSPSAYMRAQA